MYNNARAKNFHFEDIVKSIRLETKDIETILGRYNINDQKKDVGYLVVEAFSNDIDNSIDYDVSLQLGEKSDSDFKSYPLKTDSNKDVILSSYSEILAIAKQQ